MSPTDPQTHHRLVSQLFERCLSLDTEGRAAALEGVDESVRHEVEALLQLDDSAGDSNLDERVGLRVAAPEEDLPERIGPYRVLERLGEGAMGQVFLAEQSAPRRRVALKVLHRSALRGPLLRRFEFEAEILARLQHPSIARIIEAGTDASDGRPYFAMEFVEGRPLDEFVRTRALERPAILRLLESVARAVQHAHSNGIVHRDLKPANVLVTADGAPKVLDFGVARVAAEEGTETLHTVAGQIVGTMAYMSPEQAAGDPDAVDGRSDVYALGVMLHEALTGDLPIPTGGKALHAALLAIQNDVPARLGRRHRELAGDIETIVARALEKEPDRRYPSAEALAEDLRRHLDHEPILARPQTTAYQLSRFARRHRALVGGLAAAFIALAGGLTVALVSLGRVEAARRSEKAERERAEAEAGTREAVDRFLLRDMLGAANPLSSGRDVRVVDVLAAARPRIESAFAEEPEVRAGVRLTLGVSYLELGLWNDAAALLEDAVQDARLVHGEGHPEEFKARYEYARALAHGGSAEALPILRTLLEHHEREEGKGSETALRIRADVAGALASEGEYEEAIRMAREAFDDSVKLQGEHSELAMSARLKLILCLESAGDWKGAIAEAEVHWDLVKSVHGAQDSRTVRAELKLGELLSFVGRFDEALARTRSSVEAARRHYGDDSGLTILARRALANVLFDSGDSASSLAAVEEILPTATRALGENHPYTLLLRNDRVVLLRREGRFDEALAEARDVLQRTLSLPETENRTMALAESYDRIAAIHLDSNDYDAAAVAMEKALEAGEAGFGEEHPRFADILFNYGELLMNQGRLEEAADNYRRLIRVDSALRGPDHPYVASETHNLGRTMSLSGRYAEAIPVLEGALSIHERNGNRDLRPGIATEMEIARVLAEMGRFDEAIERSEAQLAAMVAAGQTVLIERLWMHGKLSYIYGKAGRTEDEARHKALQDAIEARAGD